MKFSPKELEQAREALKTVQQTITKIKDRVRNSNASDVALAGHAIVGLYDVGMLPIEAIYITSYGVRSLLEEFLAEPQS